MRALIYVRLPEGKVDERGFAAMKQIGAELPPAERIGLARFKEIVKEQYLIVLQDARAGDRGIAEAAAGIRRQREEALTIVRRVLAARGALSEEGRRRLERIEALFAGATRSSADPHRQGWPGRRRPANEGAMETNPRAARTLRPAGASSPAAAAGNDGGCASVRSDLDRGRGGGGASSG